MSLKTLVGVSLDTIAPSREIAQRLIAQAEALHAIALAWLEKNKKDLL
jgi:hypothetical protein